MFSATFAAMAPLLSFVTLAVTPDMNTDNTKPGWVAGLIFLFMFVSSALLMRSMTKHLKVARANLTPPQETEQLGK